MKFVFSLKYTFKPILVCGFCFLFISVLFSSIYIYTEFQGYITFFYDSRNNEIIKVKQTIEDFQENIKRILELSKTRIVAAQRSEEKIQRILGSCESLLAKFSFIKVQKLYYTKLSKNPVTITRFGIFPSAKISMLDQERPHEISIIFKEKTIMGTAQILNDKGEVDGFLEILIDSQEFLQSLAHLQFLTWEPNQDADHVSIPSVPFKVYAKKPINFGNYLFSHKTLLLYMLLYVLMAFFIIVLVTYYLNQFLRNKYVDKISMLEKERRELGEDKRKLENELFNNRNENEAHQLSYQSYRKFSANLHKRQKKQAEYLVKTLSVMEETLKDPSISLSDFETINYIQSYRRDAQKLAEGAVSFSHQEAVYLKRIVEETQLLFADKILKSQLLFEVKCPRELHFDGDILFIESMLMNLIGKSVHRVPKNGKISIEVLEKIETICIEIRDNGFSLTGTAEKFIKKAFDFFIPEDVFHKRCYENGLTYEELKDEQGLNIIRLIIPTKQVEVLNNNVVQLFP